MKTVNGRWAWVFAFALLFVLPAKSAEPEPLAEITSVRIERTNVIVEVRASSSLVRVTLESSARVGRRSWEPRAVHHLAPSTEAYRTFTFNLAMSPAVEILRVRGDLSEALPPSLYGGTNSFGTVANSGGGTGGATGTVLMNNSGAPTAIDTTGNSRGNETRSVAESDIWQVSGETMYSF